MRHFERRKHANACQKSSRLDDFWSAVHAEMQAFSVVEAH